MTRLAAGCLAAATLLLGTGCINLTWRVASFEDPVTREQQNALHVGMPLADCLTALGAPHFVWEYKREGVALGYVWLDSSNLSFSVSLGFVRDAPGVSFSGDFGSFDYPGDVLWFAPDLTLEKWQHGNLRELTSSLRRRPQPQLDSDK